MKLLFVHGWALDRSLWDAVLDALGDDAGAAVVRDAGYYGQPHDPPVQGPWLGVGHSLGALELLAAPPAGLRGVAAIDGFARFGQAPDFPQGVAPRVLGRMRRRLAEDAGVLTEFMARAGGALPGGPPDIPRLIAGLDRLHSLDGRACPLPIWRLNAAGDPIAKPALADASFAGMEVVESHVRPSLDHLSPVRAPEACAALIRAALEALA